MRQKMYSDAENAMRRLTDLERKFMPLAETEFEKSLARMISDCVCYLIRVDELETANGAMTTLAHEIGARTIKRVQNEIQSRPFARKAVSNG